MDRGPRTGINRAVSASDLDFCEGLDRRTRAVVRVSRTLVGGFIKKVLITSRRLNANFVIGRIISCFQQVKHVS
jgi:hypothetical protein